MGIERFFSSIEQNDITNLKSMFTYKLQKRLKSTYLLIDFNSIVHVTSTSILSDMNYLLYQILNKTFKNDKVTQLIDNYNIELDINSELKYTDLTQFLTKDKMDTIVLNKVEEFVFNILENFVDPNELKHFYIAIDGVPNITKMIEQKKRRYMGTVISELKKKIFVKYESELMKEKTRYLYEQNKIEWSKLNISPGTPFMKQLDQLLSSKEFNGKVKNICPKLKTYVCSGTDEFGEGEKKIVDYAHKNNINGDITIFSPDSDMTLLCLILSNKFKNISIMRHNQQDNNYDIINIDLLRKNIFDYVLNSIKLATKNINIKITDTNVINDIVFILTIFGNDFLPKIESFNVKYDFNKIIDKYVKVISENNFEYVINGSTINQLILVKVLEELHQKEGNNLQKIYMSSQYQNYEKLKKLLGADHDNFNQVISDFLVKLRTLNYKVRNNKLDINLMVTNEGQFINILSKLTRFQIHTSNKINHKEFLEDYVNYYKKNNKLPDINVTFRRYSRSLKNQRYRDKLEHTLDRIDPNLKVTKYDEEIFKLDNMLDEYAKKLNATSLNLGYVSIDQKSYTWKTEPIQKGVKKYYYDFFGVNDVDVTHPDMKMIMRDYMEGLMWVFDYYYNNVDKPNIWFYKYSHAPLITQLYDYMKQQDKNYLSKLLTGLKKYEVSESEFFKPEEHLMYVSPTSLNAYIVPEKYKGKVNDQLDINRIVDEVWTNTISDEIDCRGVLFLNKCHLNELHTNSDIIDSSENDKKFIAQLNK